MLVLFGLVLFLFSFYSCFVGNLTRWMALFKFNSVKPDIQSPMGANSCWQGVWNENIVFARLFYCGPRWCVREVEICSNQGKAPEPVFCLVHPPVNFLLCISCCDCFAPSPRLWEANPIWPLLEFPRYVWPCSYLCIVPLDFMDLFVPSSLNRGVAWFSQVGCNFLMREHVSSSSCLRCCESHGLSLGVLLNIWNLSANEMLCAGRVPVVPVLTTAALRGTAVSSSLGTAKLPQWSKTQAYASNVYSNLSKAKQLSTDAGCCGAWLL